MNKKILLLLPALAMVLAGCTGNKKNSSAPTSSSSDPNAVTEVEVTPAEKALEAGETVQLEANVKPFTVSNKEVTWSSDNEAKATVNASGLVTTYEAGTVHIKATSQADTSKSGQSTLTITPAYVYYPAKTPDLEKTYRLGTYQKALSQRIFFNGEFEDYPRGKTVEGYDNGTDVKFEDAGDGKYYVTFTKGGEKKYFGINDDHRIGQYDDGTKADTKWTWDNDLQTVKRTCKGKDYFPGTYNNYTTISGCDIAQVASDYIFQFIIRYEPCDPTSVAIVEATANIRQKGSVQLHSECEPEGAMNAKLTWTVLDNDKVTVDKFGKVTAAEDAVVGSKATIKATFGSLEGDTCEVTVLEKLNYGTEAAPLTIAQAEALIDQPDFPAGTVLPEKVYVKGYVSAEHGAISGSTTADVWLTNDDGTVQKEFEVYAAKTNSTVGEVAANGLNAKIVSASGWATKYNGTYELSNKDPEGTAENPVIYATENGTRVATAVELTKGNFVLEQGSQATIKAFTKPYGAAGTFEWSVSPSSAKFTVENGVVTAAADATLGDYIIKAKVSGSDPEVAAQITCTVSVPTAKVAEYDFEATKPTGSAGEYTTTNALKERIAASAKTEGLTDVINAVTAVSKVYAGQSGHLEKGIKFGTGSANGTFTFTTGTTEIKKVVIVATGWTTSDTIKIGDAAAQTSDHAYQDAGALHEYTFLLSGLTEINVLFTKRGYIQSMALYA